MHAAFRLAIALSALLVSAVTPDVVHAQTSAGGRTEVFAGSVFESYLRYLQTLGKARPEPWSIRGFSLREVSERSPINDSHPWSGRYRFTRDSSSHFDYMRPTIGLVYNTAFPFGSNDGPVWAGKGLTTVGQIGFSGEWNHFSIRIAPVFFRAENAEFPLYPNQQSGNLAFGYGQFNGLIDLPQRFGDAAYSRIDPGESTARLEGFGLAAGISTASQWWGPTDTYPFVLGNNAGGFPHFFAGTSKPAAVGVLRLHARIEYGTLSQSAYSPVTGTTYYQTGEESGTKRFMAGVIGLLQIASVPGFEVGGSRFFHAPENKDGISAHQLGLPFQNLFRRSLPAEEGKENQLGSLFIRFSPIGTGFDVYGEYGREDFSADARDFVLEPEHSATTNIGFRKAWGSATTISAIRAEAFSYEASAGSRTRFQGFTFIHGVLHQGHTYRGQLLSAAVGPGSGSAQTAAFDRFTKGGRLSVSFSRVTAYEDRAEQAPSPAIDPAADILTSLGVEVTRFVGPMDVTAKWVVTRDINRYLQKQDVTNNDLALTLRHSF